MTRRVERPPVVQFVGGFLATALIFPLIILGAGGNWQWLEGWLFALWFDVMVLANMTYLYYKDPALSLYLGCLLMMLGGPLLVGSVAGLLITALGAVGLVARILGEERMLRTELKSYAEYERKVRYRLIPYVW